MATYEDGSDIPHSSREGFLSRFVFSTNHKIIGLQYLWLAIASVLVGVVLSTLLRIHASWPGAAMPFLGANETTPDRFAALRLLHGSLMIFFVLTAAPQCGFGSYLLPLQIGAREMAFPSLNRLSFWMTAASLIGISASFFLPISSGINLWLVCAAIFSLAALFSAINFTVTAVDLRADGMTLPRMPITVWAWFINAVLGLLIFSILLAGSCTILSDRLLGSSFLSSTWSLAHQSQYIPPSGSLSIFWHRLFWYFAQAEVYVAMLPCFGFITHIIATFARRPVWKERIVVLSLCGVGAVGFCVWGYHMFATGMNPYAPLVFTVLASSLGIPSAFLLASWSRTLWQARFQLSTAVLFATGFISLFIAGGLSGLFLARHQLTPAAVNEDFVIGHFHLVMGVAATFAMLSALFFWFPTLFGTRLDESLGKLHFWATFAGVYGIFMPLHWLGLLNQSKMISESQRIALASAGSPLHAIVTVATICTVAAQTIFIFNLFNTLFQRQPAEVNPWRATTLEWASPSQSTLSDNMAFQPTIYRGAYEFQPGHATDFLPQDLSPLLLVQKPLEG
jgi:cytochrome c oxidase subunit I